MPGLPPLLFGAIADDLTGGSELAAMMVARGVPTGFATRADAPIDPACRAHVIALKTRVVPPADAVAQVLEAAHALQAHGCRQIFFKYCATFDSTPQGNIGPCAEALADLLGADLTLFCPALCETGRTLFQGYLFGGAQILAESPKRFDPLTPMTDSNLVRVLQAQTRRPVGLVQHGSVDGGAGAIQARCAGLRGDGVRFALVDAIYERDLEAIAGTAADMPLLTGNASVAAHLPTVWQRTGLWDAPVAAELPGIEGPAAVLAGSVAPRTAEQLARFGEAHPVLILDLARAIAGEDVAEGALAAARVAFALGNAIAIATTVPQDEVERLHANHGRAQVAHAAEALLARIAQRLVGELGVRRLIVAGGETAGAVVPALPVERFRLGPYQGLGTSRMVADMPHPVALMLKSGKLGALDVFSDVLEAMRHPIHAEPLLDRWPPEGSLA